MKSKLKKILLMGLLLLGLIFPTSLFKTSQNQLLAIEEQGVIEETIKPLSEEPLFEEPELPKEISIQGRVEGTGTYFEIKDSEYLNITLKSTEEIRVVLESIPKMISLHLEADGAGIDSAVLTLEGLEPNKTYFKYQDSYKNEGVFVSNENGSYSWRQDLSQPHHIWLQEEKGTIFLPEREDRYGIWNESTRTYTLTQDLRDNVEIIESNFTFDGNGHTIVGNETGYGIYVSWEKANNITIKDVTINNFSVGILLWFSSGIRIEKNVISNNTGHALYLVSSSETILNNEIKFNQGSGIYYYARGGEMISGLIQGNNISNNGFGMYLHNQRGTSIVSNTINSNNYGLLLKGNYYYDVSSNSEIKNNYISNNNVGVYLTKTTKDNVIYHNNFLNNATQAYNEGFNNLFNSNYPSGGNYWSDYQGIDEKSGPNQDQPGSDGIGDTPYTFPGGEDRYPFMRESGWEVPAVPEEFWVEVKEDGECIYQDENLTTKLKCFPQGWVLKVANPQGKSWEGISPVTQIEDVTDRVSGWTKKEFLNYEPNKQEEWKGKIKKITSLYYNLSKNFEFKKDLQLGNEGEDVAFLQIILKEEIGDPIYPKDIPATGYFGSITERALKSFQEKYGITQTGIVDGITREKLNSLLKSLMIQEKYSENSRTSGICKQTEKLVNSLPASFLEGVNLSQKIGLILSIIAQETGPYRYYDNEFVSFDWGRGIMQVTTDRYVGEGSNIKCYNYNGEVEKCCVWYVGRKCMKYAFDKCICRKDKEKCRQYYTNTPQGISANIKDGLKILEDKYNHNSVRKQHELCETEYINNPEQWQQKYGKCSINNCEEMRVISSVYRYNQGSPYRSQDAYNIWNCYREKEDWNKCKDNLNSYITKYCWTTGEDNLWHCSGNLSNLGSQEREYFETVIKNSCSDVNNFRTCLESLGSGEPFYLEKIGNHLKSLDVDYKESQCGSYKDLNLGDKLICTNSHKLIVSLFSPGAIQIEDSQGRISGIINGEIREEIPDSIYDDINQTITIFFPDDSYTFKVIGAEDGSYGLMIDFAKKGMVVASDIPIISNAIHQYTIDWDALFLGEKGVTLQIDADNDGIFEKSVITDQFLTYEKFILQTETKIDFDPDTLNLNSKGKVVTAYITLPGDFNVSQIDISSILLNNVVSVLPKPFEIGDYNNDGTPDLMVKFDKSKVKTILIPGEKVPITITGIVAHKGNYLDFKGSDIIRVIKE